jgi:CubicO group peptidase (beta-lactamase class C family)
MKVNNFVVYFLLSIISTISLFANRSQPYDTFLPYRIQSFSELALINERIALFENNIDSQGSLLSLQIEKTILEFIVQHGFIGSIIVEQNGQVVFAKGFGPSGQWNGMVNNADTTYRWDSVGKLLTTVAMIQLEELGLIDLDENITTYLPEYTDPVLYPGFAGTPVVSVRSMLAMKSGIADIPEGGNWLSRAPNIVDIANYVAIIPRSNIGTWSYVNAGFNLCSLILGRIVDPSRDPNLVYQEFLQEHIFTPAGMTTAFAPYLVSQDSPDGQPHVYDQNGNVQVIGTNQYPDYTSMRVGAGNTNGNVWDFQKFTEALNNGELISQANLTMMLDEKLGGEIPIPLYVNSHSYLDKDGAQDGMHSNYMRFDNNTMIFIVANVSPKSFVQIGKTHGTADFADTIYPLGTNIAALLFPN